MPNIILDTITYTAMRDAFHDAPEGHPVNRGHVAVTIPADEIEALESEAREGETLSQTILRVSNEIRRVTQQKEAA